MKKIVLTCFLVVTTAFYGIAQTSIESSAINLKWEKTFKNAQKLAKSKNKPLLIFFTGSDWCGPCKMLTEDFFDSDKFRKIAESDFVLYEADYPRNHDLLTEIQIKDNSVLKAKYGVNSYPTIIILDSKGNEIGRKKSYNLMRDTSYHYQFLEEVLKKVK